MEDLGPTPETWSWALEFPLPSHPDEEPNSSISGNGCKPGSLPLSLSSTGVRGPRGDFRILGLLGAARGTASNSPKELLSATSQGPPEDLTIPILILACFSPVPDSVPPVPVGNGRVHRQGPSLLGEMAGENSSSSQPESLPPLVSGTPVLQPGAP